MHILHILLHLCIADEIPQFMDQVVGSAWAGRVTLWNVSPDKRCFLSLASNYRLFPLAPRFKLASVLLILSFLPHFPCTTFVFLYYVTFFLFNDICMSCELY